jgi:hypothetical protein
MSVAGSGRVRINHEPLTGYPSGLSGIRPDSSHRLRRTERTSTTIPARATTPMPTPTAPNARHTAPSTMMPVRTMRDAICLLNQGDRNRRRSADCRVRTFGTPPSLKHPECWSMVWLPWMFHTARWWASRSAYKPTKQQEGREDRACRQIQPHHQATAG